MKISVISHHPEEHTRARSNDIYRLQKNTDPLHHPFEKAREYTRALNAVKLERMFAKPFVAALSGHIDGVYCMAKNPFVLNDLVSGSADGEVRLWDLASRNCVWKVQAHRGFVRGVCFSPLNHTILTSGDDKTIKLWNRTETEPVKTFKGKNAFGSIDHHRSKSMFATAGSSVELWDEHRSDPINSFSWGADTINTVKFNQTETSIFASTSTDRAVILYDIRHKEPMSKLVMAMKANALAWNPMEAFNFTVASEDHNCYTFDMRKMTQALNVLKDHVSAVLDVDYSPTGDEIVTGSYDKSIRIFRANQGHAREVYHTKRMQHTFCVKYSMDAKYVLSGSDDGNIRLWKANAGEKLAPSTPREKRSRDYQDSLKSRFQHMPEIKKISKSRNIPTAIRNAQKKRHVILDAEKRREENRRRHQKEGTVPYKSIRKENIITVEK